MEALAFARPAAGASGRLHLGRQSMVNLRPALPQKQRVRTVVRVEASSSLKNEGSGRQSSDDPNGAPVASSRSKTLDSDSVTALRAALVEAEMRAAAAEKEKRQALEALAVAETKANSHAENMITTTEEAVAEVESAKASFRAEVEKLAREKDALERELAETKESSINLAIKVERMAEIAIQESTAHIAEEAKLQIAAARTSQTDAAAQLEARIQKAAEESAAAVVAETRSIIDSAMASAERAKENTRKAEEALQSRLGLVDDLARAQETIMRAQDTTASLELKLRQAEDAVVRAELSTKAAEARAEAAEARISSAESALQEIQDLFGKKASEREEAFHHAIESLKEAAGAREEAAVFSYKAEMDSLRAAAEASQKAEKVKEQALARRFEALERSLVAVEERAAAWQRRAEAVEDLLQQLKEKGFDVLRQAGEVGDVLNGGRMETMLGKSNQKWQLLAEGPRRVSPDWMLRKGLRRGVLPPRRSEPAEPIEASASLDLPAPGEVWSIFDHKVVEDDVYTKEAEQRERERIELDEQRRNLEKTLKREAVPPPRIKRGKTPEDHEDKLEPGTGSGREIVFQGFNWESWRRKWYHDLSPRAADLAASGVTTIWLPPPTESVAPQGYMPGDLYNLNSAYGTVDELRSCIEEFHKHDMLVLGDVVLNHRCAQKQNAEGIWNVYGGKLAWGPEAIVRDDPNFHGLGNPSSGDIFHAAPNVDHSQEFVKRDIKEWLNWLRADIGYDGWRLDFAKGFWGGFVKEYIEASKPAFSIGEYWDSLAYEGGNVCYNQDAHRQRIINWVNATGGTSSAFDVTTKGILHSALHSEYWRLIDPQGKPPGVMGWWPSRAVTFLENHDTGSTQGHWPFPRDKLLQGYAYILTHPGTPVIFYDHFYDFGLHDQIAELVAVRNRTGVHCRSPVMIFHAVAEGYVALVGDSLTVKLGPLDWNPSKQDNLIGQWNRVIDYGADYQVWEKA
eukprot:SM000112S23996  [mRNA]  locus=s112:205571:213129:- [translate_table: standard]